MHDEEGLIMRMMEDNDEDDDEDTADDNSLLVSPILSSMSIVIYIFISNSVVPTTFA